MNKHIERATWENSIEEYNEPLTVTHVAVVVISILFLIALIGSLIWGNQGFVELLASFIK